MVQDCKSSFTPQMAQHKHYTTIAAAQRQVSSLVGMGEASSMMGPSTGGLHGGADTGHQSAREVSSPRSALAAAPPTRHAGFSALYAHLASRSLAASTRPRRVMGRARWGSRSGQQRGTGSGPSRWRIDTLAKRK
jgi:hypothetical protein